MGQSKGVGSDRHKTLLTFTGFHDPYSETAVEGQMEAGPVLTVASERDFDSVVLFSTPNTAEISQKTAKELRSRDKKRSVEIVELPLKDPTNYLGILKQLRAQFKKISQKQPDADYSICVSSGTPHMHASWLMLAASGEIPATILQTRALKHVREGQSQVTEIDPSNPAFPKIEPFAAISESEDDEAFLAACQSSGIVGQHEDYVRQLGIAFAVAQYDTPVLLLGETGVGKEVFADLIHRASKRAGKRMTPVNCSAFSETLIESQLFGHKKGAFTGADREHKGFFETAQGGTLFLDELGEMPMSCQAKLLRAIQEGVIQKVGESREIKVDVRVIAATNRDVTAAIKDGKLRGDLYYRFDSKVEIPPLRNRRTDIPRLAAHFLDQWNRRYEKQLRLSQDANKALVRHGWPGNVRELRSVIIQTAQLCRGKVLRPEDLQFDKVLANLESTPIPEPFDGFDLKNYLDDARERLLERALEMAGGNKSKAASLLNVSPQAVSQYLRKKT